MKEAVVIAVADRDRVSVAARDRFDRALTGDPDVADAFVLTAADTRAVYAAPRIHGRALELDIFILLKNRQNSSTCRLFVVYCRFFTPKNN